MAADIVLATGAEVIDDSNRRASCDKRIDQAGADERASAGDKDAFIFPIH